MDVKGLHDFEERPTVNGTAVITEGANEINGLSSKATPVSADVVLIEDSEASWAKKKIPYSELASIFGSQKEASASEGESNTSETTPQLKLNHETSSLPAGDYFIAWFFEHAMSGDDKQFGFQVQIDDTTTVTQGIIECRGQYSDSQWRSVSGWVIATLTAAVHDVDIDYWAPGGETAYIRRARIVTWRVS